MFGLALTGLQNISKQQILQSSTNPRNNGKSKPNLQEEFKLPRKNPEEYKAYMKNYMRERYAKQKAEKALLGKPKMTEDDFNVTETAINTAGQETLDLKGKATTELMAIAKKASKDNDTDEEDPIFATIEKVMKYAPIITELFKGFSQAAGNFKQTQIQPQQQQRPTMQPPEGWETMTSLQKMGRKYSRADWYAAGEKYDDWKATGGATTSPINTNYVDATYSQPAANREAQTLAELSRKHPELPQASNSPPPTVEQEEQVQPEEQAKPEFVKKRVKEPEPSQKEQDSKDTEQELINAMRQDNNKYIEMAFNYIKGMKIKDFGDSVNNIESFKPKFAMLQMILPVQTKEMLKATPAEELIQTLKEKCPEHHKWLKDNKKINEMEKAFEELKAGL